MHIPRLINQVPISGLKAQSCMLDISKEQFINDKTAKTSMNLCWELILCHMLHTQISPGEIWSPSSADKPVNIGKTTTSAQKDPPRALRIQELRSRLGQDLYGFCLLPELILFHSPP